MADVTGSPPAVFEQRPARPTPTARCPLSDATEEVTGRLLADMAAITQAKARVAGLPLGESIRRWPRDRPDEEFRRAKEAMPAGAPRLVAPDAAAYASGGSHSPCAAINSSTRATTCSGSSSAAVCGSSSAAW